jgi:hypothetical protein
MFYRVQNSKIYDYADYKYSVECQETDLCSEVEYRETPNKFIVIEKQEEIEVTDYDIETGEPIGTHTEIVTTYELALNPNFEAEEQAKEKERVGKLTCTKRVFALMLQELGITYTQLKTLIATNEQAELEWDLCVELERKNPLLDIMAGTLGITPIQLDGLFKYANGEITLEEFKGFAPVEASESEAGVLADE